MVGFSTDDSNEVFIATRSRADAGNGLGVASAPPHRGCQLIKRTLTYAAPSSNGRRCCVNTFDIATAGGQRCPQHFLSIYAALERIRSWILFISCAPADVVSSSPWRCSKPWTM